LILAEGLFWHFFTAWRRGCGVACAEDFQYLLELMGWSKEQLFAVFFTSIFFILITFALLVHKIRRKKRSKKVK
jgi:hypothetical protein